MSNKDISKLTYAEPGNTHTTDVVIIGAGPVGLFGIFECGMMDTKVHVVDALNTIGGQCSALYPEKPIYDIPAWPKISGGELIDKLSEQAAPFDPTFHLNQQVINIEKNNKNDSFIVGTSKGTKIFCKAIIIAAGVGAFGPNRPPLDGIEAFEGQEEGQGVAYLVRRASAYEGKRIVVAGGGDSAVDWSLALAAKAKKIYIVHRRSKFRAAPESIKKLQSFRDSGKIELVTPYQLHALQGDVEEGKLEGVHIKTLEGNERLLKADTMLAFFGLSMDLGPVSEWGLDIVDKHILVNPETQETSISGIFSAGDVATYPGKLKLILTGFSEIALAAHNCYALVHPEKAYHFEYSTTKGCPGK